MSRDGRGKQLASVPERGAVAGIRMRRIVEACDSLQAESLAHFNDYLELVAPDATVKAACRTLLTTGILTGTELVASKLTELDRGTADAAFRILAELIVTHDRERRARTERAAVASRDCVFVQYLDCDIMSSTLSSFS